MAKNGKFISVHYSVLGNKINGIRISGSEKIIHTNSPGIMESLMYFIVTVNIHGKISSEIIRNAVCVPVRIKSADRTVIGKYTNRQCNRPSRAIGAVQRKTEPVIHPVVQYGCNGIWLIIVSGIIFSVVDQLPRIGIVLLQ